MLLVDKAALGGRLRCEMARRAREREKRRERKG
jgi:hypothetical protein